MPHCMCMEIHILHYIIHYIKYTLHHIKYNVSHRIVLGVPLHMPCKAVTLAIVFLLCEIFREKMYLKSNMHQ